LLGICYSMSRMAILSIQSRVVAGHVGNSAAVPALQRLGYDVWAIDTVTFSNHPAHGAHTGRFRSAAELRDLVAGLSAGGRLADCDALLSGYLGRAGNGPVISNLVSALRVANPEALYLCDPVMGDRGRLYVEPAIVECFRTRIVPVADILTPNAFEAGVLTGLAVNSVADALAAGDALRARGAAAVAITGLEHGGTIDVVAIDGDGAWRISAPRIDAPSYGAGDLFSALLIAHRLAGCTLADGVARAVSSVHVALAAARQDAPDLPLVAVLDRMAEPTRIIPSERLR